MTDTHTLRARTPEDLLAVVPGVLGFHPEESAVVLTLGSARAPFHARVDLPQDPVGLDDLADHLAEVAGRHGVTSMAGVVYSHDDGLAEALMSALAGRLALVGAELACALRADGERWWVLGAARSDPDHPGTPYDLTAHPLVARAVVDGTVVHRSRRALADSLVGTDRQELDRVAAIVEEIIGPGRAFGVDLADEGRWVGRCVDRFLEDGIALPSPDVARLATLVTLSASVRDVAWAELDRESAPRHVDLWRDVVRRVPPQVRAAPAALLGFAAWVGGEGALAWCAADVARSADPEYPLTDLLARTLEDAVPPSVWRPVPRTALPLFAD